MPKGKGTYGDQVGRPSKEGKSKGMPYAPFKMSGHTLPGPNQRSALKAIPGEGEVFNRFDEIAELSSIYSPSRKKTSGQTPVGSSVEGNEQPQVTNRFDEIAERSSSYNLDSSADTLATGDTAKKKVDVEVTVNDKKI